MLKSTAFLFSILLSLSACEHGENNAPGPYGPSAPRPDGSCERVCRTLLGECSSLDETDSIALDDCRTECQRDIFTPEEIACLSALSCDLSGDACLAE